MQVDEAIKRAEESEYIKKLRGYFLCSCFACVKDKSDKINEWTLLFYNPEKRLVIDCFVNDKFVTLGDETPPISEVEKPNFDDVSVSLQNALNIVSKKFSKSTINVLITLHRKGSIVWTINMITSDMMATTFDIDAKTGKILREEETNLIRKL